MFFSTLLSWQNTCQQVTCNDHEGAQLRRTKVLCDQFLQIAVEGCCHGDLDAIYNHIQELELKNGYKVDLLLICGDFQAVRNRQDLQCMAVPNKYKEMKDFHK